jgi:predicted ArsR family transcriptional regulator
MVVPMTTTRPSILHLDREALTVLAHPLRSRLLTELRLHGPATATTLAQRLTTNTGATSYHLRRLASVGLVEEAETVGGRQRPWQAATDKHGWTERDAAGDPDAEAATDWLRRHYLRTFVERYEAWLATQHEWPLEWQDAAGSSDDALRLTPERLAALSTEIQAVLDRYRALPPAAEADASADEHVVQVYLHAFPIDAEPR